MSAFISIVEPSAAILLSDAASYDDDGVVRKIGSKIVSAKHMPVAVTSRGHADIGAEIATELCKIADACGAGTLIDNLQNFASNIKIALGERCTGPDTVQILVSAFVDGVGGVHRTFATDVTVQGFSAQPFAVVEPPSIFATGPSVTSARMMAAGIPARGADEDFVTYVETWGGDIMQVMREVPAPRIGAMPGKDFHVVGGWVDLVVNHTNGSRIRRLREWSDEIGLPINPFGESA